MNVFATIQGTNQKELKYFDSMSDKVISALLDPKIKVTRKMMQIIEATDCPHLIEMMKEKMKKEKR